jgi:hypothetical protein
LEIRSRLGARRRPREQGYRSGLDYQVRRSPFFGEVSGLSRSSLRRCSSRLYERSVLATSIPRFGVSIW